MRMLGVARTVRKKFKMSKVWGRFNGCCKGDRLPLLSCTFGRWLGTLATRDFRFIMYQLSLGDNIGHYYVSDHLFINPSESDAASTSPDICTVRAGSIRELPEQ
jgi:hypothetical protein